MQSWSSSSEHGIPYGNSEWLEGLVGVSVDCDIDSDIDAKWSGNVEVEAQSVSHEFSGPCLSEIYDTMFDDNAMREVCQMMTGNLKI